jgi:hypothetical protein
MANAYYTPTGTPGTGTFAASAPVRSEFDDIQDAFDLLPALAAGSANRAVVAASNGLSLTYTTGTLALAGNFATTGAFALTLSVGADVTITMPLVSGTLATLAGTEALTNKTISGSLNTLTNIGNSSLTNSSITINGSSVSLGGSTTVTAVASSIVVGTTGVNGGSAGRVLYDNGGTTLGEYTVTGSAGSVVLSTSPTITTPTISGALTYGGVALSASVTGTGSMVLSTSPSLSGTVGGALTFSGALTLSSALTYGGVTLSNSVTGTGSMVLSASPTLTGTLTAAAANFSGAVSTGTLTMTGNRIITGVDGSNAFWVKNSSGSEPGNLAFGYISDGAGTVTSIQLSKATTIGAALTYGGVTLSNSVTGTGSMVLSASPTLTGTLTAAAISASGNITTSGASGNPTMSVTVSGGSGQALLGFLNSQSSQVGGVFFSGASGSYAGLSAYTASVYSSDIFRFTASSLTTVQAVTMSAALTYGGVTLSNSVTGTGSMVLSTSPQFAGHVGIGAAADSTAALDFGTSLGFLGVYAYHSGSSVSGFGITSNTLNLYSAGTTVALGVSAVTTAGGSMTTVLTLDTSNVTIASGTALKFGVAYTAGAPAATGYITAKDSTGTTYKLLTST